MNSVVDRVAHLHIQIHYGGVVKMSFANDMVERILELENALENLLKQSRKTSESMGHKNPNRIFGSDDFMMVWENAKEVLENGQ